MSWPHITFSRVHSKRLALQSLLAVFLLLLVLDLVDLSDAGKFHGYKKIFHREEHGDHKTYYDDLHHGKYKKSATDSREMYRKEKKDERERAYGRTRQKGGSHQETVDNPVIVDLRGQELRSQQRTPAEARKENPRELLWHDPGEFKVQFSSAFQDFMASFNTSLF